MVVNTSASATLDHFDFCMCHPKVSWAHFQWGQRHPVANLHECSHHFYLQVDKVPVTACGITNTMIKLLEKNMDYVVSYSSPVTSKIMCTFVLQRFVGRQTGESACRVADQEVLRCCVSFGFQFHVHSNSNGGQSHGFKHSAAAREEDRDPREQRHYWSGKACREIRNHQLH